jgi:hypothetical protein
MEVNKKRNTANFKTADAASEAFGKIAFGLFIVAFIAIFAVISQITK